MNNETVECPFSIGDEVKLKGDTISPTMLVTRFRLAFGKDFWIIHTRWFDRNLLQENSFDHRLLKLAEADEPPLAPETFDGPV